MRNPDQVKARWCERFKELLNRTSQVNPDVIEDLIQRQVIQELDIPPSLDEVEIAVKVMNTGKASGKDGIVAEILQQAGENICRLLLTVFPHVWRKGEAPQDRRDAILVSLYKKRPKDQCDNCRGISFLSVVGKRFARLFLNRLLKPVVPNILPESQCDFRPNRSTMDMIFTACQIQEKCQEQQFDLYQCFIDLTKAFDTVK